MAPQKIFIAWSGDRSQFVAKALKFWLPCFSPDLIPSMSVDISPGRRWSDELVKMWDSTSAGILCLTEDNLDSLWLNFEAGVLSRSVAGSVIPYVVGIPVSSIRGPISLFHAVPATQSGTLELLNGLMESREPNAQMFPAFWPPLSRVLQADSSKIAEAAVDEIENLYKALQSLTLRDVCVSSERAEPGDVLDVTYEIETAAHDIAVWLGANMWGENEIRIFNIEEDEIVSIRRGSHRYKRRLTVPSTTPSGRYQLNAEVFYGEKSKPDNSYPLQKQWPTQHTIDVQ